MKPEIRSHRRCQEIISVKIQVTRTLILNNAIFFLSQLPLRITYIIQILEMSIGVDILTKQQYSSAYSIAFVCLMFNSCINPFLYVSCCKNYRDAFRQIYCRCLLPRNSPSDQNEIEIATCTTATSRQREKEKSIDKSVALEWLYHGGTPQRQILLICKITRLHDFLKLRYLDIFEICQEIPFLA